jgi:hypothetical protein
MGHLTGTARWKRCVTQASPDLCAGFKCDRIQLYFPLFSLSVIFSGIRLRLFHLFALRRGERIFARDLSTAARPSRFVRAVATARSATVSALQMVDAGEDDEIAFPIKVFAFDKLAHCNNFIASALYCGLPLIGDSS